MFTNTSDRRLRASEKFSALVDIHQLTVIDIWKVVIKRSARTIERVDNGRMGGKNQN